MSGSDAILVGENSNDLAGFSLSPAGDVDGDGQDPLSLPGSMLRLEGWLYAPIATVKTGAVAATPPSQ